LQYLVDKDRSLLKNVVVVGPIGHETSSRHERTILEHGGDLVVSCKLQKAGEGCAGKMLRGNEEGIRPRSQKIGKCRIKLIEIGWPDGMQQDFRLIGSDLCLTHACRHTGI